MIVFRKILIWLISYLIFLEIFLSLGGQCFLLGQFIENKRNIANGDGFRILCLGDSVMAFGGEYSIPSQLQNILNAKYPGVHFIALNQGAINATLETIYDHLPEYLDRYNPDLVVSMSGNSSENLAPKDKSSTFSSIFKYSGKKKLELRKINDEWKIYREIM